MSSENSSSGRIWKVGTLNYTLGGLAAIFCWLLGGDFAWSLRDRVIPYVMQVLMKTYGASDTLAGSILASLPAALGLLIGPVVGYKSDRLRTRWGRRIPFLAVTTPMVVLSIVGLAFSAQLGAGLHAAVQSLSPGGGALVVMCFFWTVFEVALVTANAVFGALVNDVVPQELVGRFFGLFRAVSLIVAIVFFDLLTDQVDAHFGLIFLGVGLVYGVCLLLLCLKVREGTYPPPPGEDGGAPGVLAAVKTYLHDGFGHSFYWWFFAAFVLGGVASSPLNIYSVYYSQTMAMDKHTYGQCIALTYAISLVLAYPLGALCDRYHPVRVSLAAVILYALAMVYGILFVHDVKSFGIALVVHGVVAGVFNTTSLSLAQRLLPRSRFAQISSAGGILRGVVSIILPPALGALLDYSGHQYRYTFIAGLFLGIGAVAAFIVLEIKFRALGGTKSYHPPV